MFIHFSSWSISLATNFITLFLLLQLFLRDISNALTNSTLDLHLEYASLKPENFAGARDMDTAIFDVSAAPCCYVLLGFLQFLFNVYLVVIGWQAQEEAATEQERESA